MRKILITLLAAAVAVPGAAMARPDRDNSAQGPHSRGGHDREARDSSSSSSARESGNSNARSNRAERSSQGSFNQSGRRDRATVPAAVQYQGRDRSAGERGNWSSNRDGRFGQAVRDRREVQVNNGDRPVVRQQRDGWSGSRTTQAQRSQHYDRNRTRNWSSQWRNDRRYNWRDYRNHNRSIFRLSFYSDPYGSRYRRASIGWTLRPSYYSSNFWLQDPWMYRLPPAYPPYQWVRYYDDAVLVDTYSGQVVDVLYNFFW